MSHPTVPQLVWNESLMTGVPEIDEQHMILVHTLNQAAEKLSRDAGLEVLEPITRDLLSYALYHFDTEEDLMQHYGYDAAVHEDAKLHLEQHRSFSAKVVTVRENLKLGILIPPNDLIEFLNGWLVNHILNTDKRLASFIIAKRAAKGS
jgi:hemerythrin-like metal-binding protein